MAGRGRLQKQLRRNKKTGCREFYWSIVWGRGQERRSLTLGFLSPAQAEEALQRFNVEGPGAPVARRVFRVDEIQAWLLSPFDAAPPEPRAARSYDERNLAEANRQGGGLAAWPGAAKGRGAPPAPAPVTLRDYYEQSYLSWLEWHRRDSPSSLERDENSFKRLNGDLGDLQLAAIDLAAWQGYAARRQAAARTIDVERLALQLLLRHAAERGALPGALRFPKVKNAKLETEGEGYELLEIEEIEGIIAAAKKPVHRALFRVLAGTGMRKGEALSREWSDVDWGRGELRVGPKPKIGFRLKNKSSMRTIPLSPKVSMALQEFWQECGQPTKGWLFMWRGDRISKDFRPALQGACKRAGVSKRVTPHAFRHAWCSHMLMAGVPVKTVQALGGWASPEVPMRIYAKVDRGHLHEAVARGPL